MAVVDVAPFIVVLLIGVLAGRFLTGSLAWIVALAAPIVHFSASVLTARGGDDLLSYVVPVNLILLSLASAVIHRSVAVGARRDERMPLWGGRIGLV